MAVHTGVYKYKCFVCDKSFMRKDVYDSHMNGRCLKMYEASEEFPVILHGTCEEL